MAKVERKVEVADKSPSEVYETAIEVFETNGYTVWKKRPIAYLAMVRTTMDGFAIEGNLAAQFTSPTSYILTLSSEGMTDAQLENVAQDFIHVLNARF